MQEHSMPQANNKLRDERLGRQWTQQTLADHLQTTKLTIGPRDAQRDDSKQSTI